MFHTPLLPCVFVTPPMIPAARRVPLSLPVPPVRRQPHPLRPRAWGLSIDWQESTFSQEGPWTLRGGKGERERVEKEEREMEERKNKGKEGEGVKDENEERLFQKKGRREKSMSVGMNMDQEHLSACWLCASENT